MTTYYVKNGGDNTKTGLSDDLAWATISKVNDFAETTGFSDGDVICFKRGSTFNDETLGYDGSVIVWGTINGLTFQDYGTGNKPVFDGDVCQPIRIVSSTLTNLTIKNINLYGSHTASSWLHKSAIYIGDVDNIIMDSIDGDGRGGGSPVLPNGVIKMVDVLGDVEIKNCNLHDWGPVNNPEIGEDTIGIYIWANLGERGPTTISIHDNTVYNTNADAVQIGNFQGTATNKGLIYNNTFYNNAENAIDIKASEYIYIYENTMYRDNWALGGSGSSGYLVVVHSSSSFPGLGSDHVYIYNNLFSGNNDGTHTMGGITFPTSSINNMYIYNNMFMNVSPAIYSYRGVHEIYNNVFVANEVLSIDSSVKVFIRQPSRAKIYNNTFYATPTSTIFTAIQHEDGADSIYKNNIISINSSSTAAKAYPLYVHKDANAYPTVENNIYFNSESARLIYWETALYNSSQEATWISAGHTGAQFADPLLTAPDTDDLTLQSSSPAINAGANLGVYYDDALNPTSTWPNNVQTLDQDDYGSGWEIGAYVYTGAGAGVPYTRYRGISRRKPSFNTCGGRFG